MFYIDISPYPGFQVWDIVKEYPRIMDEGTETCWTDFLESIRINGQRNPILSWRGAIVDGYHRLRACYEAGLEPLVNYLPDDMTEEEVRQEVRIQNLHRRHLNASQRAIQAAKELAAAGGTYTLAQQQARERRQEIADLLDSGYSRQEIADTLDVHRNTLSTDIKAIKEGVLEQPAPDTVTQATAAVAHKATQGDVSVAGQILEKDPELAEAVYLQGVPLRDARRSLEFDEDVRKAALEKVQQEAVKPSQFAATLKEIQRETNRKQAEIAAAMATPNDRYTLHQLPVQELYGVIEQGSLDAIITDPPYPIEYKEVWPALAEFAAYALKPEGILAVLAGSGIFEMAVVGLQHPDLWPRVAVAYDQQGPPSLIHSHRLKSTTRQVYFYHRFPEGYGGTHYPFEGYSHLADKITFEGEASKGDLVRQFEWAQSVNGFREILKEVLNCRNPKDDPSTWVICDPFMGTGVTGVAVLEANHTFIGSDPDADRISETKARFWQALQI